MIKTAEIKARELLSDLSLDEKIYQLCCQMVYPIRDDYYSKRNYKVGNCRNIGHFLHESKGRPVSPEEVIQIYFSGKNCDVVMPMKELKAYKRFGLNKKEALDIIVEIPDDAFFYYDRQLKYGMHNGDYTISVGTSSTDIRKAFEVRIRNGLILTEE